MGDFRLKCQHLIMKNWSEMKIELEAKVYTKPNSQSIANSCARDKTNSASPEYISPPLEIFILLSKML